MSRKPTALPCIAPIQFLCHDDGPIGLNTLEIDGGTVLFLETRKRYLITARHVWEGIITLSDKNAGRKHGAFVYAGKLLPLKRDDVVIIKDDDHDVIVMEPSWLSSEIVGHDFYKGESETVSVGDIVTTWGYPGAKRTKLSSNVTCQMDQLTGAATQLCNKRFKFVTSAAYDLGGFSGAPVFRADNRLVGLVSEASSALGIVTCYDLQPILEKLSR